jgi:hypothetical protein
MLRQVIDRVGIARCQVIRPKIVLILRGNQMKTMQMCVNDMFNTLLWNPFLWVKLLLLVHFW